jgi:Transposase DDE domain
VACFASMTEHDTPVAAPLAEKDIRCLGHLRRAFAMLDRLHEVGCERDRAGNRELFFDDYCKLVLLYVWNPLIESVHDLQQAVGLPKVAKALGVKRFSSGSFSESVRVFDPRTLEPVIAELAGQLSPAPRDPRLAEFKHALTLVDATVLPGLARLAKLAAGYDDATGVSDARYTTSRDGLGMYGWRVHTQLDLRTFHPIHLRRTGARNAGANRENNVLRASLEAGRCYVCDGGYADRSLFDDITDAGSSYVIRVGERSCSIFEAVEQRPPDAAALEAGVVRDTIVRLSGATHRARRVELKVRPHPRRTRGGFVEVERIILYTNLLELPAELVALIYRYRYTAELFFRCFKQLLGMRHLLSQRAQGIDIQIYCTLIVCILIQLVSGKRPGKAMRNIVGWYLLGLAEARDVIDFLNRPDNTGVKTRAKDELWKKLGY